MESERDSDENDTRVSSTTASGVLDTLNNDRDVLVSFVTTPPWLYPAVGVVLALFVASPAIGSGVGPSFAVVAVLALLFASRVTSRVRRVRLGWCGMFVVAGLVAVVLVMLSTSLGLLALKLNWWTIAPVAATFAATLAFGRLFDRFQMQDIRRGR